MRAIAGKIGSTPLLGKDSPDAEFRGDGEIHSNNRQ